MSKLRIKQIASGPAARTQRSKLTDALDACRKTFIGIALFSALINLLMLTGAIFMLEVYDRVLPSRSVPTLVGLAILAAALFALQGILDVIRSRLLVRVGAGLDQALSTRVYEMIVQLPIKLGVRNDGLQPMRDLDSVRSFLSGTGPIALFDMPWLPFYLAVCFIFHPLIGLTALGGAIVLIVLTLFAEMWSRAPIKAATSSAMSRQGIANTSSRNSESLVAMGMIGRMAARWSETNREYMAAQQRANDVVGGLGAISRVLRLMLQSGVLAVGAYLVIQQQATAGIIIAGAILSGRALAPVDLAIGNWKGFMTARESWRRLNALLAAFPVKDAPLALDRPSQALTVEAAFIAPPGAEQIVLHDISFLLRSGNGLGVIGQSASGKSSLARLLVGVWEPVRGAVRFDGATRDQWSPEALGKHVGYLPQDVELFAGTVAENISRFDSKAEAQAVIAAAHAAGVHDLILGLPDGYETQVGEQGTALSVGQAQRIALARALYGDPFLVVLDEPNSNLDAEGDAALTQAILNVRARGGIAVVIAHRPSAIAGVDLILTLHKGRIRAFGPKDQVLQKVLVREEQKRHLKTAADSGDTAS
jgi:ATP-binding cassette, subfamily C, bacterial PrsD